VIPNYDELLDLAGRWCDDRLTDAQRQELEVLLRADVNAIDLFVEYVQLHGQLQWEGGGIPLPIGVESTGPIGPVTSLARATDTRSARRHRPATLLAVGVTVAALVLIAFVLRPGQQPDGIGIADTGSDTPDDHEPIRVADSSEDDQNADVLKPLRLDNLATDAAGDLGSTPLTGDGDTTAVVSTSNARTSDAAIVARIDELLLRSWEENEVMPASYSSDEEWVRRATLTFTGRIPTLHTVTGFVDSKSPRKRSQLLDDLLDDDRLSESMAVIWTNLLIGRSPRGDINAGALFTFLEQQFEENQPWIDTVGRLLAAEGRNDEVGETNFLLAHLNSQATPATAVVSRLFLCEQVHCMQCHDHPTSKSREQEEFWALNAFFKQARRDPIMVSLPNGKEKRVWDLEDAERGGMTFFENRRGQQMAVLPEFDGRRLTADPTESRRQSLAEFLEKDSRHRVARAMVNRMWAHFFGAGFTNPVDDMGPHNPPSHPELLDELTDVFVASDYDLRRLMRWIAMTDAWQRTAWPPEENVDLDPLKGGTPVFAQVYPRHMTPEEVYESIRVAIRSIGRQPLKSSVGSQHRREWVGQFVQLLENDENEETLTFDGDVSQALLMMNGPETERALPLTIASMLAAADGSGLSATEALAQVSLATIARDPTDNEDRAFRSRHRSLSRSLPPQESLAVALEDMLWAYLNSSEFVTVH
jgi:Protein of unknown function (DUF1549)/Protein of unknown function (DUF1553)